MRFLIDENLSPRLAAFLAEAGHDVLFVPTSVHRGQSDEALHDVAAAEGRIVFTRDVRFPVTSRLAGFVLVRSGNQTPSQLLTMIREVLTPTTIEHLSGRITVIAPGREPRSRPLPTV